MLNPDIAHGEHHEVCPGSPGDFQLLRANNLSCQKCIFPDRKHPSRIMPGNTFNGLARPDISTYTQKGQPPSLLAADLCVAVVRVREDGISLMTR
jgi:hypothetical protein